MKIAEENVWKNPWSKKTGWGKCLKVWGRKMAEENVWKMSENKKKCWKITGDEKLRKKMSEKWLRMKNMWGNLTEKEKKLKKISEKYVWVPKISEK